MSTRKDVGLLLVDESELIPTEVGRKKSLRINEKLNFRSFDIGSAVVEARTSDDVPYENYYRHFKADLALPASVLKSPDGRTWEMKTKQTDQDRSHGGQGEILRQDGGEVYHYFNPKTATYVFLRKLCARAVKRAREITGIKEGIKVHLTAPAYEDTDKNRSQRYRDHIRDVIADFETDRIFAGVDFVVNQDRFLYEPYGVYYYYAFLQESVPLGKDSAGETYLIFDMGGSTTDVGIVQINRKGKVTTVYPICKSIDCAGAYFDRYILKYLRGEERLRQISAKWNPEFEKIERAKITLCEQEQDKVELEIKGDRYTLTREKIAAALQELWEDDNRPLAQGFRGFLDDVRQHARENSLFLEFDKIEKVFLAGGSTGLPGLKNLIQGTLKSSRFELLPEGVVEEDIFEEPTLASSSSVAALGRAAELANVEAPLVLSRANHLYAKITDESGNSFSFRSPFQRDVANLDKDDDETFLFSRQELERRLEDRDKDGWAEFDKGDYQNYNLKRDQSFPGRMRISLRTNVSEYPPKPQFSERVSKELKEEAENQNKFWFSASCQAQYDEDSVRVKPFVYLNHTSADNPRRLYREQGSERVSLKPGRVEGNVHICIDLGMNNAAVAICTPEHPLPENQGELKILKPAKVTKEEGRKTESTVSGDGAMTPDRPKSPVPETTREQSSPSAETTLSLSDKVLNKIENIFDHASDRDSIAESLDLEEITEVLLSSLNGVNKRLDKIVGELRKIQEEAGDTTSSAHPGEQILEEVSQNYHGYGTSRTREVDFESFARFVREHEKGLHYPDSILRSVWMHTQQSNNRLCILAGPPGCGKSSLVELVAEFFNRDLDEDWKQFHLLQPVSPTWFSPGSLLGSYSEIDGQYHGTEFLRLLMTARQHYEWVKDDGSPRLFFACLDEFNLAQPEQYMADILSKMEAESSRSITLCRKDKMGWTEDLTVELAPNLKLFATINTDVSTKTLSPKVLDRSVFIRLTPSYEDLEEVAEYYSVEYGVAELHDALFDEGGPDREESEPEPQSLFGDLVMIGQYGQTPIGYRVLEQSYEYASHHPRLNRAVDEVLDEVVCNFYLPKLPGAHAAANPVKYGRAVSEEQAARIHKYPRASQILKLIESGVPGQTAV